LTARVEQMRGLKQWDMSLAFSLLFVFIVVSVALVVDAPSFTVYPLSFWHYYLYWLAYRYGTVSLGIFKRDAIVMKSVALAALGYAYLSVPADFVSLAVVGAGFLLNIVAARALGSDRTYYGHEVAGLPQLRVTAFPYSWISHPMLVGNVMAYAGTLINADFRMQWWPLACVHVALNLGLLVMERFVAPLRRAASRIPENDVRAAERSPLLLAGGAIVAAGAAAVGALGVGTWTPGMLLAAGLGACVYGYACVLRYGYTRPPFVNCGRHIIEGKGSE